MTPRALRTALPLAAAALAVAAAPALAAPPVITSADADDIWNAQQTVTYVITADRPGALVRYRVDEESLSQAALSPITVTRPNELEGEHRLQARAIGNSQDRTERAYVVDRTPPPAPTVMTPAEGAVLGQGQVVTAAYACADAVACAGDVPSGGAIDTSVAGPGRLTVTAADAAGNTAALVRSFTVAPAPPAPAPVAPPPPSPLRTAGSAGDSPPPALRRPPATAPSSGRAARPTLLNPRRLTPRAGVAFASLRPTLRWRAHRGASLYNVQIFRMRGTRLTKVLSAFPRRAVYKLPRGRLRADERYVWRVWPFLGRPRSYAREPLGISFFTVKPRTRSAPAS